MSPVPRERAGEEIVVNWRMVTVGGALLTVAFLAATSLIISAMGRALREEAYANVETPRAPSHKFADMPVPPAAVRETAEQATRSIPVPEVKPPKQESAPSTLVVMKKPDPVVKKPVPVATVPQPTPDDEPSDDKPRPFKRFRDSTESQLTESLARLACEVDLESEKGTAKVLLSQARQDKPHFDRQPILKLLEQRADLHGLPVRKGSQCLTAPREARALSDYSRRLHTALSEIEQTSEEERERSRRRATSLSGFSYSWQALCQSEPAAVPAMVQILQAADQDVRRFLVAQLAYSKADAAVAGLVQRALFDVSAEVREEAVRALSAQPRAVSRSALLAGLRHPWPAAAEHAAEALVHLQDRGAIHGLIDLVDRPPPTAPVRTNDQWKTPELVRVNHLRNCLMCHAPSFDRKDAVRGRIPVPGEPLPKRIYYDSPSGDFVRADIVYLRQDFSVKHQVDDPNRWPTMQRFDYLVRARTLTADEARLKLQEMTADGDYPQRQAVLFALRELTGHEASDAAGWRRWVAKQPLAAQLEK